MSEKKRLIFKVNNLKKSYGTHTILKITKLENHPGTINGLIGPIGSGKTTLLNLLAGCDDPGDGSILFDGEPFKLNWRGKIITNNEIFFTGNPNHLKAGKVISGIITKFYGKKSNVIQKRYFDSGHYKQMWNRSVKHLTEGEKRWLDLVLATESDPRVLLLDDYGVYLNQSMEQKFRTQLIRMNRNLGTTMILAAPYEIFLKTFASVFIHLDNGHVSKIRSRVKRHKPKRHNKNRRK